MEKVLVLLCCALVATVAARPANNVLDKVSAVPTFQGDIQN